MADKDGQLVLHTSTFGRVSLVVAPILVVGVGWGGALSGGLGGLPGVILAVGIGLLVNSLFFQPLSTMIGQRGIQRRCLARRQLIPWEQITGIVRTPGRRRAKGGLMARTDRGRHLLTDQAETLYEYDLLRQLVARYAPQVSVSAEPPIVERL